MDPKTSAKLLRPIRNASHRLCDVGGYVAQYMGDGVLVYFGYPQAHEHDAERAVCAGLQLIPAVYALKSDAPLQSRVGIATGVVVVGDLIGWEKLGSMASLERHPTSQRAYKALPHPIRLSLRKTRENCSATYLNLRTLGRRNLKASRAPHVCGKLNGQVRSKVASRHCTRTT